MENSDIKIGLVIMASGLGKRFGSNKLIEPLEEKPVIDWILDKTQFLFDKRIVVTRSEAVKERCVLHDIECIVHDLPYRSDTVRLGLLAMMDAGVDFCFFSPADQPLIKRETLTALTEQARRQNDRIIRPAYLDTVGAPIGFPQKYFEELLNLPEGKGGGFIAKKYPSEVSTIAIQNEWELWDIDTVSDMEKIKNVLDINNI